jgi:hypothetical protein
MAWAPDVASSVIGPGMKLGKAHRRGSVANSDSVVRPLNSGISPARGPPAWDDLPVDAVPDWDALAQPSPEYVFNQEVQW